MSETEVENLVVRLTGDGSEYAKMLKDSQVQTQQVAQQVEAAAGKIEGISNSLKGFAAGAVSALGALGVGAWLREALGNFQEAETIGLQLNATLESNGRAVDETRARYDAFALSIESITTHEDDAVLAMLRTAETFNVTGAAAEEAVRSSIALAAATGGSAEGMIRLTAALAQGNVEQAMQFARMVPQLRGIRDESEFVARAQQLIAGGMKAAAAETESSAGAMKMLKRDYGNMLEDVGKIVAETIQPVVKGVREAVAWFRQLPDSVKQGVTVTAMLAVAVLSVAAAITIAGVVFNTLFGGVGLIIGAIITAGVAVGAWVTYLGGVKEAWEVVQTAGIAAWEWIKAKALAFWEWLGPITDAAVSLAVTSWEIIKTAATITWDWITARATEAWAWVRSVWEGIFRDAEVNWGDVQKVIQTVLLTTEFYLLNFKRVNYLLWLGIKIKAGEAWDFIRDAFIGMAAAAGASCGIMSATFIQLWRTIRGESDAEDFITGIADRWQQDFDAIADALGAGTRTVTEGMVRQYAKMRGLVGQELEAFIAERLSQFAVLRRNTLSPPTPQNSPGAREQEQMRGAVKEAEKFDAVLRGSAEALSRIAAYQERNVVTRTSSSQGTLGGSPAPFSGGTSPSPSPISTTVPQDPARDRMIALLTSIDANITLITRRPAVNIQAAALN